MELLPKHLSLGILEPGEAVTRKVIVRSRDEEFELEGVPVRLDEGSGKGASRDFADACSIAAQCLEPGRAWEIALTVKDMPRPGPFTGWLTIKVDHPLEELVRVSFAGANSSSLE